MYNAFANTFLRFAKERVSYYGKNNLLSQKDFDDLTGVVEEIEDRIVNDNKQIKNRLKELENNYSNNDVENAVNNANKIIKVIEKELKDDQEKSKQKINELKAEQEANKAAINDIKASQDFNKEMVDEIKNSQEYNHNLIEELKSVQNSNAKKISLYLK